MLQVAGDSSPFSPGCGGGLGVGLLRRMGRGRYHLARGGGRRRGRMFLRGRRRRRRRRILFLRRRRHGGRRGRRVDISLRARSWGGGRLWLLRSLFGLRRRRRRRVGRLHHLFRGWRHFSMVVWRRRLLLGRRMHKKVLRRRGNHPRMLLLLPLSVVLHVVPCLRRLHHVLPVLVLPVAVVPLLGLWLCHPPVVLLPGLVVRHPHLHVQVDVGVLVEGGRLAVLPVHEVYAAVLGALLGVVDLLAHPGDGVLVSGHALLGLGHKLLVPLRVHQLALQLP